MGNDVMDNSQAQQTANDMREVRSGLTKIAEKLAELSGQVHSRFGALDTHQQRVEKTLFIGNGRPPLSVTVPKLSGELAEFDGRLSQHERAMQAELDKHKAEIERLMQERKEKEKEGGKWWLHPAVLDLVRLIVLGGLVFIATGILDPEVVVDKIPGLKK